MAGFIEENQDADPFFGDAVTLAKALEKHRKLMVGNPNLPSWAKSLAKAQRTFGEAVYREVLTWYLENIGRKYVPLACSGETFRRKFAQIQSAMRRAGGAPKGEPTELAHAVAERLSLQWPREEKSQELFLIQRCLDFYEWYSRSIRQVEKRTSGAAGRLRDYHLAGFLVDRLTTPQQFAERWVASIHDMAWNWAQWEGNLLSQTPSLDHPRFERDMRDLVTHYCLDPSRWDIIQEELTKCESEKRTTGPNA